MTSLSTEGSLTTKEGWRAFVDRPPCLRPEALTPARLATLGEDARWEYDQARRDWHANFGTIVTPQLQAARMELELRVATNRQRGDQVRPATALDGLPGVGKTTIGHFSPVGIVNDLTPLPHGLQHSWDDDSHRPNAAAAVVCSTHVFDRRCRRRGTRQSHLR